MHLDFAKKDLKKAADMVRTLEYKLQNPVRGVDGTLLQSAIWRKWEKDLKAKIQVRETGIMSQAHMLPAFA